MMKSCVCLLIALMLPGGLAGAAAPVQPASDPAVGAQSPSVTIRVGSKKFTEGVILGEILRLTLVQAGFDAEHLAELGGTRILWNALRTGEIDAYVDYTGTIGEEILAGEPIAGVDDMRAALAESGVAMSEPLGFNNTYALGMQRKRAADLGIGTISDLARHSDLRLGFSNEFMDRPDGWAGVRQRYRLPHGNVTGLDHDVAYRGLASGAIDVTDLYSTDAEIRYYDLVVLEDDLHFFPSYEAVVLYRPDLAQRAPGAVAAIRQIEGTIPEPGMIAMNARSKIDRQPESAIAAGFVEDLFGVPVEVRTTTWLDRLRHRTIEHLKLVGISLTLAILVSIPLGVLAAKVPAVGHVVLGSAGVIQTIPALALLAFMIPLLGLRDVPAVTALFLYSLLPIIRNTTVGLQQIPLDLRQSADALGLSPWAKLLHVELPMASPAILAGIKTAAVINVGFATLGALIGAGGYGQPILTGIRLDDIGLILEGAVPAAVLALLAVGFFNLVGRAVVPEGLRLKAET